MENEQTIKTETKVLTVPTGGDVAGTAKATDDIMDGLQAFVDRKAADPAATPTPAAPRKETTPATPEQKKELEALLGDGHEAPAKSVKTEAKPEKKAESKSEVETVKAVKDEVKPEVKPASRFEDLSPEGINREVDSLKTGKAETKERFAAVLTELKKAREEGSITKKEYEAAKAEVAVVKKQVEEISKKAETPPEELQRREKEANELAMLRRTYILDHDPKLKEQFDDKVTAVEENIIKTLTESEVPPKAIELIQKSGGWLAFSQSKTPLRWNALNADGETIVQSGTYADYARGILNALNPAAAATVNARTGEQVSIRDSKDRFVTEEKAKAKEFFTKMETDFKAQTESQKDTVKRLSDAYNAWVEKEVGSEDALKDLPVPEKATAAEKLEITAHNEQAKTLRDYVKAQAKTTSLEMYTELVHTAMKGKSSEAAIKSLTAKYEAAEKRAKELQEELDTVRKAGNSVAKPGSVNAGRDESAPVSKKSGQTVDDILSDLEKMVESKQNE